MSDSDRAGNAGGAAGAASADFAMPISRLGKLSDSQHPPPTRKDGSAPNCDTSALPWARGFEREVLLPPPASSPISVLPMELLVNVFGRLDTRTLTLVIPLVCRRWLSACPLVPAARLDFTFLPQAAALRAERLGSVKIKWLSNIFQMFPQVRAIAV